MYSEVRIKERWLLDTNVLIDLIIGLSCHVAIKSLSNGSRFCSSIVIRNDIIQKVIQNEDLEKRIKDEINETVKNIASVLTQKKIKLVITSVVEQETHNVIEKIRRQEKRLNSSQKGTSKLIWSLLPLDYIINYKELIGKLKSSGFIYVINVEDKQKEAEELINNVLKGRYDRRDWHLIAALINNELTAIYTDEESVAHGLRNIAKYLKKEIDTGNFGNLLLNLRVLNILSSKQFYVISYYAYKFQRLLYSHQMIYEVALNSRSKVMSANALSWVVYSQRRLHHYVPLDRIIKNLH